EVRVLARAGRSEVDDTPDAGEGVGAGPFSGRRVDALTQGRWCRQHARGLHEEQRACGDPGGGHAPASTGSLHRVRPSLTPLTGATLRRSATPLEHVVIVLH